MLRRLLWEVRHFDWWREGPSNIARADSAEIHGHLEISGEWAQPNIFKLFKHIFYILRNLWCKLLLSLQITCNSLLYPQLQVGGIRKKDGLQSDQFTDQFTIYRMVFQWEDPCACMLRCFSCVQLCATPWTVALQTPLSTGILQGGILDWVAMSSSRGSSQPRDWTHISYVFCIGRQVLYH